MSGTVKVVRKPAELGQEECRIASLRHISPFWIGLDADPGDAPWIQAARDVVRQRLSDSDVPFSEDETVLDLPHAALLNVVASSDLVFDQGPGIYLVGVMLAVNQTVRLARHPSMKCVTITWRTEGTGIAFRHNYVDTLLVGLRDRLDVFIDAYHQARQKAT